MKKTRVGILAALVAAVTGFATPVASAAPSVALRAQSNAQAATDFWTPEAMRAATPLDNVLATVGNAVQRLVPSGLPSAVPASASNSGGPWSGGGKVTRTAGRVFFLFNGAKASCSGDAVTSGNKSVVITAGHCVKYQGTWHTNWVFVPGYDNGNAPYGEWAASQTLTTPQWEAGEDLNYDVGAAVVQPLNGRRLTDVVGGQGIAFNQQRGQTMYTFGYPAEGKYDGTKLDYCSGSTFTDFISSNDNGMRCDMTGGSSGGPWFVNFDEGTGTGLQNSVNSFGYTFMPGYMFGPYFGSDVQNLYKAAQSK
ncbi:peptidase [Amycolatopsis sp. K13G38]|uniref:Peptidase n=1 Tax=Amycolatopsis acididurans TaxID=2724524 RepID=A0ABX1JBH6_9PSEU|nr:peptidase [Amycolatopsis acididurans]NKQ56591.1 peptidase [Amycolatopsis acididurans]